MRQKKLGEDLYNQLKDQGLEVLLDDRIERAGVKFNDSDLIGIPVRVTVGKQASEGNVECKDRRTGESKDVSIEELSSYINQLL